MQIFFGAPGAWPLPTGLSPTRTDAPYSVQPGPAAGAANAGAAAAPFYGTGNPYA